jgi:phytoene dehydrogenase-like protein
MSKIMRTDVAIIGGGLAGLAAATYLAQAERAVTVFEKAHTLGGRARTEMKHGFAFNFGPHALYRKAYAVPILRELGVKFSGALPAVSGAYALARGAKYTLPSGLVSLLATGLLSPSAKLEAGRFLARLGKIDAQAEAHCTVREWLEREIQHPRVRQVVQALLRVSTYANDPDVQSAGAAIKQFQVGLEGGVYYLDGGWQTLVNGLSTTATQAGANLRTEASVIAIEPREGGFFIQCADGKNYEASSVIIAASPLEAARLVKSGAATALTAWAKAALPVRAACLDVALAHMPDAHARFGLGIDQPYYFSVHSATAKLAPHNGALIHVAKYLSTQASDDAQATEEELEQVLDMMQPGWREAVIARRYLPRMTVSHALVTAAQGGLSGRPGPAVPGLDGLFVAGDWVGNEGQLADASLASAKRAAEMVLQRQAASIATTA